MRHLAVLFMAITVFSGCSSSTEPSGAPPLPPTRSMTVDLNFFNSQGTLSTAAPTKLHFANAATRAALINVTVLTVLTPPRLAFALAANTTPSLQEDGSYIWIYTWTNQSQDFQIRLHGKQAAEQVDWELYLVPPGEAQALWFSGTSNVNGRSGFWVFRDVNDENDPSVMRVDWNFASTSDASLQFTNIAENNPDLDDVLSYLKVGGVGSINFEDASESATWDIQWDESTGSGSLQVPEYNAGQRACWDTNRDDTPCASE